MDIMHQPTAFESPTANDTPLYLAGHVVPAGTYQLVGSRCLVRMDSEGILPATCDGRVAVYQRCANTWGELQNRVMDERPDTGVYQVADWQAI